MFERLLYTALQQGIAAMVANPRRLTAYFTKIRGYEDAEAAKLVDLFRRVPPMVYHQYPRTDSKFPMYSIILAEENETDRFLDNLARTLTRDEAAELADPGLAGAELRTSLYTQGYHVWTVTEDPDVTAAYYQLSKYILTARRSEFIAAGVVDLSFGGSDLSPNESYLPAYLFVRRLHVSARVEEVAIDTFNVPGRGKTVAGIHVADGSSEERMGGVDALVEIVE